MFGNGFPEEKKQSLIINDVEYCVRVMRDEMVTRGQVAERGVRTWHPVISLPQWSPLDWGDIMIWSESVITKQNIDPITEMLGRSLSDKWSYYFKHCVSNCSDDSIPGPGRHRRNCFTGLPEATWGDTSTPTQIHEKWQEKTNMLLPRTEQPRHFIPTNFLQISEHSWVVRHWLHESRILQGVSHIVSGIGCKCL